MSDGPSRVAKIADTLSLVAQLTPKSPVAICLMKIQSWTVVRLVDAELAADVLDLLRIGDLAGEQVRRVAADPVEQEEHQQHRPRAGSGRSCQRRRTYVGQHGLPLNSPLPGDFLEEGLGRRIASKKLAHHVRSGLLAAPREDQLAEAPADGGIHEVLPVPGQHVQRDHFGPHVAVVAGAVAAEQVLEGARELGAGDVARRRLAFHPDPRSAWDRPRARRTVPCRTRRTDAAAAYWMPLPERARGVKSLTSASSISGQAAQYLRSRRRGSIFAPPFFVHLRGRLDEIALDAGAAVRSRSASWTGLHAGHGRIRAEASLSRGG